MRCRASIIVLLAIGSALSLVPAAAPADVSLATYRTNMNAVCRVNTTLLEQEQKRLIRATKAKDTRALLYDAGRMFGVILMQDRQLEQTPFPTSLHARMAPILLGLHQVDKHINRAIDIGDRGDVKGMIAKGDKVVAAADRVSKPLRASIRMTPGGL
jgi:hypothetical protein